MPRVALVTCRPRPGIAEDPDLPVLVRELTGAGVEAAAVEWDDPAVDWAGFDLAVIRSTWDYSWRAAEFTEWAARCGTLTRLANPADVVRWNTDKRYLGDLAAAGVPVVPTRYLAAGDPPDLPAGHPFVVKPTSGAGARLAARYTPDERGTALRQLRRMHAEGYTAMVQPYVTAVDRTGERALQFFGGRLLHASRKGAVLRPGTPYDARKSAHPGLEPWSPSAAEREVAERALAAVPGAAELLYARVDLVDDEDGRPQVMELELVEPNLFLWLHPASLPAVTAAIVTAAAGPRPRSAGAGPR
ncbi:ATP-grasp domain-containing protein [Streptomyces sp. enrichment culture]|uniref:ATP-grasp domain-containing protein n=1 Tax=Streptomyces sp. enrichment culture TaxID=1795815 RepID=UPI003F56D759